MFQEQLISQFRDEVNNRGFVYFKYKDVEGKSHWNAICSCMDWLTVSVRSINELGEIPKDIDEKSKYFLSLISYVDIIEECITTLHSVLSNEEKRKSPFDGDTSIFKGAEGKDDNQYFKELRARFGAHPVNLKDSKSGERHFASWPHDSLDGNDLTVMLYSNMKGGNERQIHINRIDLIGFSLKRFKYLNELIEIIQKQYEQFVVWCRATPIKKVKNPTHQIELLLNENQRRLGSEYIEYHLNCLKDLLPASIGKKGFEDKEREFKSAMLKLTDEIFDFLQNARFDEELRHTDVFSADALYKKNQYVIGKLMSALLNDEYGDPLNGYYFEKLRELDLWGYEFTVRDRRSISLLKVFLMNADIAKSM